MKNYRTLSEMWAGQFGSDYLDRHAESNRENFDKRCRFISGLYRESLTGMPWAGPGTGGNRVIPESVLEVGCGDGKNLLAIRESASYRYADKAAKLYGADVSKEALGRLHPRVKWIHAPAHDLSPIPDNEFDIVFTCGLLIHIPPKDLTRVYAELWRVTKHVLFIAEYFAPRPRMIPYRERDDILWARDFGGELLETAKEDDEGNDSITVIDYGHEFKAMGGYDDLGWWIFKKEQNES